MRIYKKTYVIILLITISVFRCVTATPLNASQDDLPQVDRISYTLFNDFETGELYGWEPYPYQQDTGYDALFFTRKEPTYKDSKHAHNTTELYQGFTKRLNLWTTAGSRLQAAVYFKADIILSSSS